MGVIIGIDVGGSTTKIVGFDNKKTLMEPLTVKANDPLTSTYGALGKFISENGLKLSDIDCVAQTGVGSTYLDSQMYDLNCKKVAEFDSVGKGGLYLSELNEAIVVSMGTGTAFIHAKKGDVSKHLGGTGVGGGTLLGLSHSILDVDDIDNIIKLAEKGDLEKVDLRVNDIAKNHSIPTMPDNLTASNFGKLSDLAKKEDLALGIINMIFETVAMMSVFNAKCHNLHEVVLTGNMTTIQIGDRIFNTLGKLYELNFKIPQNAQYATAVGAALSVIG